VTRLMMLGAPGWSSWLSATMIRFVPMVRLRKGACSSLLEDQGVVREFGYLVTVPAFTPKPLKVSQWHAATSAVWCRIASKRADGVTPTRRHASQQRVIAHAM